MFSVVTTIMTSSIKRDPKRAAGSEPGASFFAADKQADHLSCLAICNPVMIKRLVAARSAEGLVSIWEKIEGGRDGLGRASDRNSRDQAASVAGRRRAPSAGAASRYRQSGAARILRRAGQSL